MHVSLPDWCRMHGRVYYPSLLFFSPFQRLFYTKQPPFPMSKLVDQMRGHRLTQFLGVGSFEAPANYDQGQGEQGKRE